MLLYHPLKGGLLNENPLQELSAPVGNTHQVDASGQVSNGNFQTTGYPPDILINDKRAADIKYLELVIGPGDKAVYFTVRNKSGIYKLSCRTIEYGDRFRIIPFAFLPCYPKAVKEIFLIPVILSLKP